MTALGIIVAAFIIGHDIRKGLEKIADAIHEDPEAKP